MKTRNKVKKEKTPGQGRSGAGLLILTVFALAIAVALFFVMIHVEKNALAQYERNLVYVVADSGIAQGTVINETNAATLFVAKEIDASTVPTTAITDLTTIYGKYAQFTMDAGLTATSAMFKDNNEYLAGLKNPREISIGAGSGLSQVVSGTLRANDLVDIYFVVNDKSVDTSELTPAELDNYIRSHRPQPLYSNVPVTAAFDSAGTMITNDNRVALCQMINIIMDEDQVSTIISYGRKGTLYITRVVDVPEAPATEVAGN